MAFAQGRNCRAGKGKVRQVDDDLVSGKGGGFVDTTTGQTTVTKEERELEVVALANSLF